MVILAFVCIHIHVYTCMCRLKVVHQSLIASKYIFVQYTFLFTSMGPSYYYNYGVACSIITLCQGAHYTQNPGIQCIYMCSCMYKVSIYTCTCPPYQYILYVCVYTDAVRWDTITFFVEGSCACKSEGEYADIHVHINDCLICVSMQYVCIMFI